MQKQNYNTAFTLIQPVSQAQTWYNLKLHQNKFLAFLQHVTRCHIKSYKITPLNNYDVS